LKKKKKKKKEKKKKKKKPRASCTLLPSRSLPPQPTATQSTRLLEGCGREPLRMGTRGTVAARA
jgi:hypothetical protein